MISAASRRLGKSAPVLIAAATSLALVSLSLPARAHAVGS